MVRRCSDKLAKTLMVVFNLVFLICGITIVAVAMTSDHPKDFDQFVDGLKDVNYVFLGVGIFISLISFLGCCGAWKESSCMITCFMVLLTAILIAEIAVGGVAFSKRGEIETEVRKEGLRILASKEKTNIDIIDDVQSNFKCCGINDFHDYEKVNKTIPESCCSKEEEAACTPSSKNFHAKGCYGVVVEKVKSNLLAVGTVAIVVCFIELVGIIFACCLRGAINERYESV